MVKRQLSELQLLALQQGRIALKNKRDYERLNGKGSNWRNSPAENKRRRIYVKDARELKIDRKTGVNKTAFTETKLLFPATAFYNLLNDVAVTRAEDFVKEMDSKGYDTSYYVDGPDSDYFGDEVGDFAIGVATANFQGRRDMADDSDLVQYWRLVSISQHLAASETKKEIKAREKSGKDYPRIPLKSTVVAEYLYTKKR